ncbi:MAG: putative rane protein [Microbacterium sp.]|jgi:energy-converting hydrogenase Eha subunit G|nr:putative rane protein [Microbacterium sp.]
MEILLGLIIGAVIGLGVHFALPHRDVRGATLAPFAGAAASAVTWTVLTWAGFTAASPLLWLAAIAAPALTTLALVPLLSRTRRRRDAADRARLGI